MRSILKWGLLLFLINITFIEKSFSAISFRSKSLSTGQSNTSITASEPSGTAKNDLLIMFIVLERGYTNFIAPSGWTQLYNLTSTNNANVLIYWIRRGVIAPAYAMSWTSAKYIEVSVTSWKGVITSGTPFDATASNVISQSDPANPNCPAITTTVKNTMIIALGMTWAEWRSEGAWAPTGYTLIQGSSNHDLIGIASKVLTAAGFENPSSFTNANGGLNDKAEITLALKPSASPVKHRVIFN